jgi:hypothetical protein
MQTYIPIPNPTYIIKLDENKFLDKHVKDNSYATMLLEIYSGMSIYLNNIQSQNPQM